MKNVLKWIVIAFGGLVGLLILASVILYAKGSVRINTTHEIQPENIAIPTSDSAIARGQHLVEALTFCQEYHGDDLGGEVLFDEPMMATVHDHHTHGRHPVRAKSSTRRSCPGISTPT